MHLVPQHHQPDDLTLILLNRQEFEDYVEGVLVPLHLEVGLSEGESHLEVLILFHRTPMFL